MNPSTRSGRPHAARVNPSRRSISRQNLARISAPQTKATAASVPSPQPIHNNQPSWEELFGRR